LSLKKEEKLMSENVHTDAEYVFDKKMTCAVCDRPFTTKVLKSNRARRIGCDADLRPRFQHIDTLIYGVCSCPHCGYSATHSAFAHIAGHQIENVMQQVSTHFMPEDRSGWDCYTYDQAIRMHELALQCADAKLAKDGEKAYLHLLLSWLYQEKKREAEEAENADSLHAQTFAAVAEEHYQAAYDGFQQAIMNEMFPIAGLDQPTLEYIIAYMAFHFGKMEVAAKTVGSVLTNSMASRNVKDRAFDLKDAIIKEIKEKKKQ
jgi:hypothetical protein